MDTDDLLKKYDKQLYIVKHYPKSRFGIDIPEEFYEPFVKIFDTLRSIEFKDFNTKRDLLNLVNIFFPVVTQMSCEEFVIFFRTLFSNLEMRDWTDAGSDVAFSHWQDTIDSAIEQFINNRKNK